MNIHSSIRSYCPERSFFDGKQQIGARICREDCVLIDINHPYRILASRGKPYLPDTDFMDLLPIPRTSINRIYETLLQNERVFYEVNGQPLLLFSDWIMEAGILLVILPRCKSAAIYHALLQFSTPRFNFLSLPSERVTAEQCREAFDILSDIFRYTNAILSPTGRSFRSVLSKIAVFSGFYPEPSSLADLETTYSIPPIQSRTAAFLLCAFLHLRYTCKDLHADAPYRIRFFNCISHKAISPPKRPSFMELPCFDVFDIKTEENALTLILSDSHKSHTFSACSNDAAVVVLRIERVLEITPHKELL